MPVNEVTTQGSQWPPVVKNDSCPFCQAKNIAQSPSGRHAICQGCGRILVTPAEPPGSPRARRKRGDLTTRKKAVEI